jgi:4-deoxy-L-threo-5-hexosulose-uronate ketol-isomerase
MSTLDQRFSCSPSEVRTFDTAALRRHFLVENLMVPGHVHGAYSHFDRMAVLGAEPLHDPLALPAFGEFTRQPHFLARRELGVINIGGPGFVRVDESEYPMKPQECLYIGMGPRNVLFGSLDTGRPACFYMASAPAHRRCPDRHAGPGDANRVELGTAEACNVRTIYQFIHPGGIESCQLVMGLTALRPGSVWNTFPPHVHHRRMEVYFYFDLPENQRVCHLMGEPGETRHLFVKNMQAVISPDWSIHAGAGSSSYSFIWAMAGENMEFADMDPVGLESLK